jgi:hypothetical protein
MAFITGGRMGKLKIKHLDYVCDECGHNFRKLRIGIVFRVDGVDKRVCKECATPMYIRLRDKLIKEGKDLKTGVPKDTRDKTLIVLTDPSDYVSIKLVKPENTLITSSTNPDLFKGQKEIAKIKAKFNPEGPGNPAPQTVSKSGLILPGKR